MAPVVPSALLDAWEIPFRAPPPAASLNWNNGLALLFHIWVAPAPHFNMLVGGTIPMYHL